MEKIIQENKGYVRLIYVVSVLVPLLVAILLFTPIKTGLSDWVKFLPTLNAILNSTTAFLLILALIAIKLKNVLWHRNLMLASLLLGALFLISYVIYHSSSASTIFGDINHNGVLDPEEAAIVEGSRLAYIIILLSHIGLSFVVVPLVLIAFYFALSNQIDRHTKIVKFTYPIWLYVSISGVVVYLLISPYYI